MVAPIQIRREDQWLELNDAFRRALWEGNEAALTFYLRAYVDNDGVAMAVEILRDMINEHGIWAIGQGKWATHKLIDLLIEEGKSPAAVVVWLKDVALTASSRWDYLIDDWAMAELSYIGRALLSKESLTDEERNLVVKVGDVFYKKLNRILSRAELESWRRIFSIEYTYKMFLKALKEKYGDRGRSMIKIAPLPSVWWSYGVWCETCFWGEL